MEGHPAPGGCCHATEALLLVHRACADLRFELVSQLTGSAHWAAPLPLPTAIPFVIRHLASGKDVFASSHECAAPTTRAVGELSGTRAGLYVGEMYALVVPSCDLFDESSVEFSPIEGQRTACAPAETVCCGSRDWLLCCGWGAAAAATGEGVRRGVRPQ